MVDLVGVVVAVLVVGMIEKHSSYTAKPLGISTGMVVGTERNSHACPSDLDVVVTDVSDACTVCCEKGDDPISCQQPWLCE